MKAVRPLESAISIVLSLTLVVPPLWAQESTTQRAKRRFGIIGAEAEGIDKSVKTKLLESLRSKIAARQSLIVLKASDSDSIFSDRTVPNDLAAENLAAEKAKYAEIEKRLMQGRRFYLESEFDEAVTVLEEVLKAVQNVPLVVERSVVEETLKTLAASHFFLTNLEDASQYLRALLDLDSSAVLSADKFPPPLIDVFNSVKNEPRTPWSVWEVESSQKNVSGTFLGSPLTVNSGDKLTIMLPKDHSTWKDASFVMRAEGYVPQILKLSDLPEKLNWEPVSSKGRSYKGIFAPVGNLTPSPELKRVLDPLRLDVVLLLSAQRDADKHWYLSAQWYDLKRNVTSPISSQSNPDLPIVVTTLAKELLQFLDDENLILADMPGVGPVEETIAAGEGTSFYKTWWFWTIVGVGLAGAGAGSYLLFKKDDQFRISVKKE